MPEIGIQIIWQNFRQQQFYWAGSSLPSCQLVQLTQRCAYEQQFHQYVVQSNGSMDEDYLNANSFPTVLALHSVLDDRIATTPSIIQSCNYIKRKTNAEKVDEIVDECT
jgi:hypothetical protein